MTLHVTLEKREAKIFFPLKQMSPPLQSPRILWSLAEHLVRRVASPSRQHQAEGLADEDERIGVEKSQRGNRSHPGIPSKGVVSFKKVKMIG